MFETVFLSTFWMMVFVFGGWLSLSLLSEFLTWLNDGDEEFFEGTWPGRKFGGISVFGYPIKYLTSGNTKRKVFIIPYMLEENSEAYESNSFLYLLTICISIVIGFLFSFIVAIGISLGTVIIMKKPLWFLSLFFLILLSVYLKKKIRETKKTSRK